MARRNRIINKENIVVGSLIGGLGNQLFIIFTTISYAIDNNLKYGFINNEKKRKTYFDTPLYKNISLTTNKNFKNYKEESHEYKPIPIFNNIILNGYFQSYLYFEKNRDKIIELLGWKDLIDKYKTDYDGFIHFRIGDYKNIECHPVCDINYYINALNNLINNNLNILYFFEENDKIEVEGKIKILKEKFVNINFIPIDTNLDDYEQVFIMSHLKYCIIANSTFSWWGAYLNNNKDKKVYYPKKWFEGSLKNLKTEDKFPKDWIMVN
jgi:hypothetical protein